MMRNDSSTSTTKMRDYLRSSLRKAGAICSRKLNGILVSKFRLASNTWINGGTKILAFGAGTKVSKRLKEMFNIIGLLSWLLQFSKAARENSLRKLCWSSSLWSEVKCEKDRWARERSWFWVSRTVFKLGSSWNDKGSTVTIGLPVIKWKKEKWNIKISVKLMYTNTCNK